MCLDTDQRWIVDYAGPKAGEIVPGLLNGLEPAREFARRTRSELASRDDKAAKKLFGRYSTLVRYLESRDLSQPPPRVRVE